MKHLLAAAALALGCAPAVAQPDRPAAPAPAPAPSAAVEPRPAIWLLSDADTSIYLFGTFHILPPNFRWRSARFDQIAGQVDELVLEVTRADTDTEASREAIFRTVRLGKQASVLWRVSADRREALRELLAASGIAEGSLDGMQTWVVAMSLGVTQIAQGYGAPPGQAPDLAAMPGVEDAIEREFLASNRPVSGVETTQEQIGFLSNMSFVEQRELLEGLIDASLLQADQPAIDDDHVHWAAGNSETIAAALREMPPMLYQALVLRRNRAWTDWLIARLDRPGSLLFAVGAGHLGGADSVQNMLAARGFTARRIY